MLPQKTKLKIVHRAKEIQNPACPISEYCSKGTKRKLFRAVEDRHCYIRVHGFSRRIQVVIRDPKESLLMMQKSSQIRIWKVLHDRDTDRNGEKERFKKYTRLVTFFNENCMKPNKSESCGMTLSAKCKPAS